MSCPVQEILTEGRCFYGLNPKMLLVVQTSLLCSIINGGVVPPVVITDPPLLSDDGNWYTVSAVDLGGGAGTVSVDQTAVPPGTHPYLVLLNIDDGLFYKFSLIGTAPVVFWEITGPIVEAETPTVLTDGATNFSLRAAAGPTVDLLQI